MLPFQNNRQLPQPINSLEPTSDPFNKPYLPYRPPIYPNVDSIDDTVNNLPPTQTASPTQIQGIKNDQGKERWNLMPFDALREIAKVFTKGANKYSDRNWEKGLDYSRPYSALQRHLAAWWEDREENDSEWGLSHLAHAGCCLLMLLAYQIRNRNKDKSKFDDRPIY